MRDHFCELGVKTTWEQGENRGEQENFPVKGKRFPLLIYQRYLLCVCISTRFEMQCETLKSYSRQNTVNYIIIVENT